MCVCLGEKGFRVGSGFIEGLEWWWAKTYRDELYWYCLLRKGCEKAKTLGAEANFDGVEDHG